MTQPALDSAFPPSAAQIAAARAAGYVGWNGYFAGQNIYHGWSDGDFKRVLAGGLSTLAFCSGWANPTAMKIRGEALGIPIMLDCEGEIRGDGPWLQPWLNASGAGLYANYWVFPGKQATRNMLCAYPTSGDPWGASWNTGYVARPAGPCGWQWAGSHNEFGITVDSEWLDDGFYGVFGPGGGTIGDDMTPAEHDFLYRLFNMVLHGVDTADFPGSGGTPKFQSDLDGLKADVAAIKAQLATLPGGGGTEPAEPKTVTLDIPAQQITGKLT